MENYMFFIFGYDPEIDCTIKKDLINSLTLIKGEEDPYVIDGPELTLCLHSSSYEELKRFAKEKFEEITNLIGWKNEEFFFQQMEEAYLKKIDRQKKEDILEKEIRKLLEA